MAGEIRSAAEATKIAATFLKEYYAFLRPVGASRDNGTWTVKIDIGLVTKEIAEVKVDAITGTVTDYSLP